jgi:hypothetical protein
VSESETHIQQGLELRRASRNGEALVEFQKAFALDPTPRARAQVALALQALGDWLGAERWLEEALRAQDDSWIREYRSILDGALATIQAHLGRLYVDVNVKEGEAFVNGVSVHALPTTDAIRVMAGDLDVEIRAPGYASSRRALTVAAGAEVHEAFTLEALPPAPSTPSSEPRLDSSTPPAKPKSAVGGYVALGAAGVLTLGGVVAWRIRQTNVDIWNDDSRCLRSDTGQTRGQLCGGNLDAANIALGVEIGAFAAAAVSAGIGVWLLIPRRSVQPAVVGCAPSGYLGIACSGRF